MDTSRRGGFDGGGCGLGRWQLLRVVDGDEDVGREEEDEVDSSGEEGGARKLEGGKGRDGGGDGDGDGGEEGGEDGRVGRHNGARVGKKKRGRTRRKRKGKKSMIRLAHWNANALLPREEMLKEKMDRDDISLCALSETKLYKHRGLSDRSWIYEAGYEFQPTDGQKCPKRGGGVLAKRGLQMGVMHVSEDLMAVRLEMAKGEPILVVETHFQHSSRVEAHKKQWARIAEVMDKAEGEKVLLGDMNAHCGANGDDREDEAGRLMEEMADSMGLVMVNKMGVCRGAFTRVIEGRDGTQTKSTIDYAFVSKGLVQRVKRLTIEKDRMGSDHKMLVVEIEGELKKGKEKGLREVWRVERLPEKRGQRMGTVVDAFQRAMAGWIGHTISQTRMLERMDVDARRVADIMEWSFATAMDEVSEREIGVKKVGPKSTPRLDATMRMMNDHRKACETMLKRVMANGNSTSGERTRAVRMYRDAKRDLLRATAKRKQMEEGELFRQIEEKQADSKLFWGRAGKVTDRMKGGVSPPPMVNRDGETETDPMEVLRAWREFSAGIASQLPEEEGRYDDEYKRVVEERLEMLRRLEVVQEELDRPITEVEVFRAIRKLKVGKAPGMDGILTSILKTAADAVGTNKLGHGNSVVQALALMFNYMFEKGEWPKRWGSGIIFPLFKEGSRLEPSNYRPITLLSCVGKLFGSIVEARLSGWSERTGLAQSDFQGGFRRSRGAPDQIFLLREILSSRKERGLPTLVSYVDCRKAYDTVWRDGNYVRLFDAGVQGRMWKQIQRMGAELRSRVRMPFGETDWFEVLRGVAQGAPESPWLYSNFINGLAEELVAGGFGVLVGDTRVPLLMYADDVVMLASTVYELRRMNDIATQYAFKYRFRYNGEKSAVMVFNANKELRQRVEAENWRLSGERVMIRKKYKYLGVDTTTNAASWRVHAQRIIKKATSRSRDLLWICGRDKGLRPRSAATLWTAVVRPVMEYAAELWAGEISEEMSKKMEKIQTDFARSVLGLTGCWGVPNVLVRAELGLEKLEARREKLRMGYWRRVQVAETSRAFYKVAVMRRRQVVEGTNGDGMGSWMWKTRELLWRRGLGEFWDEPESIVDVSKERWKEMVYQAVEERHDKVRGEELAGMNSMKRYSDVRSWGRMDEGRAAYAGEVGRMGALVCERYLDDVKEREATKLKIKCRAKCMPLMKRVMKEANLPPEWARCVMCDSGDVEDEEHFLMKCKAYERHRERMMEKVAEAYSVGNGGQGGFEELGDEEKMKILLGQQVGGKAPEDNIDHAMKRYVKRAWRARKRVTRKVEDLVRVENGCRRIRLA
jgi:exonuclease III